MNAIWQLSIDDYLEIVKRSQERGILPGESMELVLIEYMKEKGKKPAGHTELNKEEFLNDIVLKSKNGVLHQEVNKDGNTKYKLFKKGDKNGDV